MKQFIFGFLLALFALLDSPAHAQVVTGPIYCNNMATASTGVATETQIIPAPGTGSARTYICGYTISAAAATNVTFQYGTGTNCATGSTNFGPTIVFAAAGTFNELDVFHGMVAPSGSAVCATGSAAATVTIYYVQF